MNNAYNYNPYMINPYYNNQQQYQTNIPTKQTQNPVPTQQYTQPQMLLQEVRGKMVDSIENGKNALYPMDGLVSYFPLLNGTAIVTKQIQSDGNCKITIYEPVNDDNQIIQYVTENDLQNAISKIEIPNIDQLMEEIKNLKDELKELKKKKKDDKNE